MAIKLLTRNDATDPNSIMFSVNKDFIFASDKLSPFTLVRAPKSDLPSSTVLKAYIVGALSAGPLNRTDLVQAVSKRVEEQLQFETVLPVLTDLIKSNKITETGEIYTKV
jgi:hypothetical protein